MWKVCLSLWKAMTSIPPDISLPPIPSHHQWEKGKCVRVFVFVSLTTLQVAYTTCPREVPFSAQAIKSTSFSRLWNHSGWNIGSLLLSVLDKSLLWEMFGKQTGDKLRWATASELKEKNVSTTFGRTCSLVLLTNIWRRDETEPLTQWKVQFMRLKHLHLVGICSRQAEHNNKSEVTRRK